MHSSPVTRLRTTAPWTLRALPSLVVAALLLPGLSACGDDAGPSAPTVARVEVAEPARTLITADTAQLSANVTDVTGALVANPSVAWRSSDTTVAVVGPTGLLTTRRPGTVAVSATVNGVAGQRTLTVARVPLAGLWVSDVVAGSVGVDTRVVLLLAEAPSGRVHGYGIGVRREYQPVEGRQAGGDSVTLTIQDAGCIQSPAAQRYHQVHVRAHAVDGGTLDARATLQCSDTATLPVRLRRQVDTLTARTPPNIAGTYEYRGDVVQARYDGFAPVTVTTAAELHMILRDPLGPFVRVALRYRTNDPADGFDGTSVGQLGAAGALSYQVVERPAGVDQASFTFGGRLQADSLTGTWQVEHPRRIAPWPTRGVFRAARSVTP
jgi:hypothetical protein